MIEKIEKRLKELIPPRDETIFEAARYSLFSGGKRLRPRLLMATAADFGVDPLTALDPACAIEMIHTSSLIHDDLPCIDDDDLRRGRPTLHKVYGEAMAVVVGDYLLSYPFEVIANCSLGREQRLQIIQSIAKHSGGLGMIGGQAVDIEAVGHEIDEETLIQMYEKKTSALFIACLECGSLVAGYPPTPLLQLIGKELGIAYQYQNDFLGAFSTPEILGKKIGTDAIKKKPTAISLFGKKGAFEQLKALEKSIFEKIVKLPNQGNHLSLFVQKILVTEQLSFY